MSLLFLSGTQFSDDNGVPAGAAKLYIYDNGTTNAATTYSDPALSVANSSPVVLNSAGRLTVNVFAPDGVPYTYSLTDSDDADIIPDVDDVWGVDDAGIPSVVRYGALTDGTDGATTVTAFTSAATRESDAEFIVTIVPPGTYAGALAGISVGTRHPIWLELGDVTYSTSAPPGSRIFGKFLGDVNRGWLMGNWGVGDDNTDGSSTDRPTLRVHRVADHTGGTTGGTVNASAFNSELTISDEVDNYENAIIGTIVSSRAATTGETPNFTVVQGVGRKTANDLGKMFGANFVSRDESGSESSVSLGAMVGSEIVVVASGPDDSNTRVVLDLIARAYTTHASSASVYAGLRVRPSASSVAGGGSVPMDIENAILIDPGTLGSITNGIFLDGGMGTGIRLRDVFSTFAVDILTDTNAGTMRLGSTKTSGTVATLAMPGHNAVAEITNYARILSTAQTNTDGAEAGSISLTVMIAGADTTVIQAQGTSPTNPVYLFADGSLQQVTVGAADSGGSGYKVLRVPN